MLWGSYHMISWENYQNIVVKHLNRKIDRNSNPNQNQAIQASINKSQFIVAGPGSGKTTVMVLKILKFIFVDDVPPKSILATTFTRKAAAELRSRILDWGDKIRQVLLEEPEYKSTYAHLRALDFNQIITGTLDSISEDVLRNHRKPGSPPPVVVEDFVASALLLRNCLFPEGRHRDEHLYKYLKDLSGMNYLNLSDKLDMILEIKDRLYYDQVRWNEFKSKQTDPGAKLTCQIIDEYEELLKERLLYDFAKVEAEFLDKLKGKELKDFTDQLKILMVDEYQDSNLLQEQIYFSLASFATQNGGSIIVVGDDDQSLYRFRGATVDLFTHYKERLNENLKIEPVLINLSQNYRSTKSIVDFVNEFSTLDSNFQQARVEDKPVIKPSRKSDYTDFPVIGIFRDDPESLAQDISKFIHQIVHGEGYTFQNKGKEYQIRLDPYEGSATDLSILMSSPQEITKFRKVRMPHYLRKCLKEQDPPIEIFNPRGESLERENTTITLVGLILECIDPDCEVQNGIEKLPGVARNRFKKWRKLAREYIENCPEANPLSLKEFVEAWQKRKPIGRKTWKTAVPLLDLTYKLVHWIPTMQNDIEGIVYLEALTRTISQTGIFSSFGGDILYYDDNPDINKSSIKEAIWNIFVPLASGAVEVDEGLLDTLPRDRLNIMSIHQSKGLEFPIVFVDVGSDIKQEHHANAFKRFPNDGGKSCNMEDEIRSCSPLQTPKRSRMDRAFDDLTRLYFVAFSRPQDLLILIGLNSLINEKIPHVATGWSRDRTWHWKYLKDIVMIKEGDI